MAFMEEEETNEDCCWFCGADESESNLVLTDHDGEKVWACERCLGDGGDTDAEYDRWRDEN